MYEQYTDKQIVEMLVPKLNKAVPSVDWNMVIANAGCNWRIIHTKYTFYIIPSRTFRLLIS